MKRTKGVTRNDSIKIKEHKPSSVSENANGENSNTVKNINVKGNMKNLNLFLFLTE
jgi:hypothetical protein